MMQGVLNPELLCAVLEQIFAERDNGLETTVTLIDKKPKKDVAPEEKTA